MRDGRDSQQTPAPFTPTELIPDKNFVRRKHSTEFLHKLFSQGSHFEQSFRKICEAGCPAEELGWRLWATCTITSCWSIPLLHSGNITKAQLKGLPKRLRALADIIKSLNATPLAPGNEVKWAPENAQGQLARGYLVQRYEMLPGMLYVYAHHLERFSKIARKTVKRLTMGHLLVVELLCYVEKHTGSPCYKELADLLEHGCFVAGGKDDAPGFLTVEGLAKMYQRWGGAVRKYTS
jgi:hypothetical protein